MDDDFSRKKKTQEEEEDKEEELLSVMRIAFRKERKTSLTHHRFSAAFTALFDANDWNFPSARCRSKSDDILKEVQREIGNASIV
jgi:hypothetical protein